MKKPSLYEEVLRIDREDTLTRDFFAALKRLLRKRIKSQPPGLWDCETWNDRNIQDVVVDFVVSYLFDVEKGKKPIRYLVQCAVINEKKKIDDEIREREINNKLASYFKEQASKTVSSDNVEGLYRKARELMGGKSTAELKTLFDRMSSEMKAKSAENKAKRAAKKAKKAAKLAAQEQS